MKGRKVSDGTLGLKHSEETRKKMSESAKGVPSGLLGVNRPSEHVAAVSAGKRNKNPAWRDAALLYGLWVDFNKPSGYRFRKMIPPMYEKCESIVREFEKGWNPKTNPPENA